MRPEGATDRAKAIVAQEEREREELPPPLTHYNGREIVSSEA